MKIQNTSHLKIARAWKFLAPLVASALCADAQTTYTGGSGNWTEVYADRVWFTDPVTGPFDYYSGDFNASSPYNLGLWSSGSSPFSDANMGQVEARTFTTNGSTSGANQALSVGQSFLINMGGATADGGFSRAGIETGGRIGFTLARGTDLFNGGTGDGGSRANGGSEGMMRVEFVGGQSNAQILSGPGEDTVTQSGMPTFDDFKSGQYYRVEILSDNEFTLKYGPTAATATQTYNIMDFLGTGTIGRIQVYNLGANMDALYGSIVVSNMNSLSLTSNTGETRTVSGVISDNTNAGTPNHIVKDGAGLVSLTNSNTHTGNTTIQSGTLAVTNSNALGTAGSVSVARDATLRLSGNIAVSRPMHLQGTSTANPSIYSSAGSNTVSGPVTVSGNTTEFGTGNNANLTITGGISGSQEVHFAAAVGSTITVSGNGISTTGPLGVEVRGAGHVLLNATNTFTGAIFMDSNMEIGSAGNLQNGNASMSMNLRSANATLTYSGAGDQILSGAIAGNGSIQKNNASSTLTLSGSSTYLGSTTVSAGTLAVTGSINNSTATVQNGATLSGSGSVGGLILNSGAIISPGNSPGTLSVAGNATWNGGANLNWQVASTNANPSIQTAAGTGWDFVDIGGTLTLGVSTSNKFHINLWSLSSTGPDANGTVPGWDPAVGSTWLIASAAGGIYLDGSPLDFDSDYSSYFNINTSATAGAGGWSGGLPASFNIITLGNANNLYLQALTTGAAAVPEPGQIASSLLLLAAAGGWMIRKRIRVKTHPFGLPRKERTARDGAAPANTGIRL